MEFRLLGPLEAVDGDVRLTLGSRKSRALLARLLLDANRTVSVERLVDDLWGDDVPDSALKMVQIYVSHLRKVLPPGVLRTQAPGYLVEVEPEALDLSRFSRMRTEGREALEVGDASAAAALLTGALGLWRGTALAEFSEPFARVARAHLEELRLGCLEDRVEADLAIGRTGRGRRARDAGRRAPAPRAAAPAADPRPLPLGPSGRGAGRVRAIRRTLDEQIGIEPSPVLKALQHKILNQDPSLDAAAREQRVRQGTRAASQDPAPDAFVGRVDELAQLETLLDAASGGDGSTAFIAGRAGIGKSRLVAELGRRARSRGATAGGIPRARAAQRGGSGGLGAGGSPLGGCVDPRSADFLVYGVARTPVLLLGTYRSEDVAPGHPLQRLVSSAIAARAAVSLELEPLDRDSVGALVRASSGTPQPETLVDTIFARSEGNPLFTKQLLAATSRGDAALPPALRDMLLADVARLGATGRSVLRLAAAAGRDAPYELLRAVMPVDELELAEALRQAVDHALLVPDQAAGTFRLRHALFAEALYETLLPGSARCCTSASPARSPRSRGSR